jgi:hypothetical protein
VIMCSMKLETNEYLVVRSIFSWCLCIHSVLHALSTGITSELEQSNCRIWGSHSVIFWDIMLCGLLKINQHLWGTCHLRLQGHGVNSVKQAELSMLPASWRFHAWLILLPQRWRWSVHLKCRLTLNGLYGLSEKRSGQRTEWEPC